jgi:hypothetical protein
VDKYYIGKGAIDGRPVKTAHTLSNFRGELEDAARVIAAINPGIEGLEVTENGDSERGHVVIPGPPTVEADFTEAMMSPPRTVKVKPLDGSVAPLSGKSFNPRAAGIPKEEVPASQVDKIK